MWRETDKESKLERSTFFNSKWNANEEKMKKNGFLSIYFLFLLYDLCLFHIKM